MSITRRIKREQERQSMKHQAVLGELLGGFYELLSSTPQPTNEAVRSEFLRRKAQWINYCALLNLKPEAKDMFVSQVSAVWNRNRDKQTNQ